MKKKFRTENGFTLLELVIVLGLIALVTHLAVREMGQWRRSKLGDVAERQLEELRSAILGDDYERDVDGMRIRSGFVADMGRLPQAVWLTNTVPWRLSLAELWLAPPAAERFDVRPAIAANMVAGSEAADFDGEVYVAGGWRGPYIRMAVGARELRDAWGNPFTVPDDAGYVERLLDPAGDSVTNGAPVAVIRYFGADGLYDNGVEPLNRADRDGEIDLLERAWTNGISGLAITLNVVDGDDSAVIGAEATFRVYSPVGGKIAVHSVKKSNTSGQVVAIVGGLTPGPRVLRVEYGGQKSLPRRVMLAPGINTVTERVVYK
jgi:prepilin-type N-terminal cleavage/methylation domain-containing protein